MGPALPDLYCLTSRVRNSQLFLQQLQEGPAGSVHRRVEVVGSGHYARPSLLPGKLPSYLRHTDKS